MTQAEAALKSDHPDALLLRTGTVFYAEAARRSAEREFDWIGAGSLLGMLVMIYAVFRTIRPMALGLLSVTFGIVAAMAVTIMLQGELHLVTLIFGASLIGESIDYSVQYFAAHLGAGATWEPMTGLRQTAPGLTVALATSLLGYGALTLLPFPALSQIGLFALVGLAAAWLTVFLLLPALLSRPSTVDPAVAMAAPRRLLLWWINHMTRRKCALVILVLLALTAPGWLKLTGNDDVHQLVTRPATLVLQEERIRSLTGFGNSSQFFLIEGKTPDAVLVNEERLTARLKTLSTSGDLSGFHAISAFVPSGAKQAENRTLWNQAVFSDLTELKALFARNNLRDGLAYRQAEAFRISAGLQLQIEDWLQSSSSTPFHHLWLGPTTQGYASAVLPQGARDVSRLAEAAAGLPGVSLVDKAGSVSRLFHDYRQWGSLWLCAAFLLVYGVLWVRYQWLEAIITLVPTLLATLISLGIFGHLGIPLTLFNLMGLILVLGVGVNYSIFLREGGIHATAKFAGVLLSASTTLLSFGFLAFSATPALSGFGLTLLIGIGIAVLLAPMVFIFSARPAA